MREKGQIFKYYIVIVSIISVLGFVFSSCDDDDDIQVDTIEEIRKNKEAGEKYMANIVKEEGVLQDPSGLCYKYLTYGEGEQPGATDTVCIHYDGYTISGRQFISKTEKKAMEDLKKGLHIGLRHTKVGGKTKLYIPYYLMNGASSEINYYEGNKIVLQEYSALVYEMKLDSIIFVR